MEKTNLNNRQSGEGCYVPENATQEQHLIGRREQKYIENHEKKLIEDKGAEGAAAAAVADVEASAPKKKGWFGWWAAAFLAVAVIGLCLYFATRDSRFDSGKSTLAYSGTSYNGTSSNTTTGRQGVRRHVTVIQPQVRRVVKSTAAASALSNVNARAASSNATAVNAGNSGTVPFATEASINSASANDRTVDYLYYFGNDKSAVADNAILDDIAEKAKDTGADITITAYASEVGTPAYNMQLSEQRAENLANYLIAHGVQSDHVRIKAAGETARYGDFSLNRRADILVDYAG